MATVAPKKKPSGKGKPEVDWADKLAKLQAKLEKTNAQMATEFGVSQNTYQQWKYRQRDIPTIAQKLILMLNIHGTPEKS